MDDKQIINQRQLAWLTASIITSGGILTLQNVLIRVGEMDAWFSYLLPTAYVFLIAAFFAHLVKHFPGKHIFEIARIVLGKWAGALVSLLILFHTWLVVVRDISTLSKFSSTLLLQHTPIEIMILLPCLLLVYFGRSSIEVIARVNDLFYPLFVITVMLMPVMLSNEFFTRLITPVLTTPPLYVGYGSALTLGSAGDVFILGAFLHTIYSADEIRSSIRHGTLLGMFLLTLVIFMTIIVLGPVIPGNFLYPTYNLVQMIHITDFLDRLDIVILTIWFPTLACKIIAIYMALLIGISSLLNSRSYPVINKPVALCTALTAIVSFNSITEVLSFSNYSSPIIVLAYQPLTIAVIWGVSMLRKKRQPAPHKQKSEVGKEGSNPSAARSSKWSSKLSYPMWIWCGNALLCLCAACLAVGLRFGKYMPNIGIVCASLYALCFTLAAAATYMEVSRLKKVKTDG